MTWSKLELNPAPTSFVVCMLPVLLTQHYTTTVYALSAIDLNVSCISTQSQIQRYNNYITMWLRKKKST